MCVCVHIYIANSTPFTLKHRRAHALCPIPRPRPSSSSCPSTISHTHRTLSHTPKVRASRFCEQARTKKKSKSRRVTARFTNSHQHRNDNDNDDATLSSSSSGFEGIHHDRTFAAAPLSAQKTRGARSSFGAQQYITKTIRAHAGSERRRRTIQ